MKTRRLWITASVALFMAAFVGGCKDDNVSVVGTCPLVISTSPVNLATAVPLNKVVTVTFNEAMNPATITPAAFTLLDTGPFTGRVAGTKGTAGTPVPGTVSYNAATFTMSFVPTAPFTPTTGYAGTVSTVVKDMMGNALQVNFTWTFSTVAPVGPPTVASTDPLNTAVGVVLNKKITATFSEAMNPTTITGTTFTLFQGVTPVAGAVTYLGTTATFTPTALLTGNTLYTATVTTGAKNVAGTSIAANYVWTFTTGIVVAPAVTLTDPVNLATNVALNKVLTATFSTAMDPLTITATTFTLAIGATPVAGAVTYSGTTATFTPSAPLIIGTNYTATITTGAKNVAGTPIAANFVWSFNTGAVPTVMATDPLDLATNIALNKVLTATFSTAMDPLTITGTTFTLAIGVTPVAGAVTYSGTTATFTPSAPLVTGTNYTATITTGAKNVAGTAIATNFVWSFSTGAAPTITATDPLNLATNVALNKILTATFSEAMDPLTITGTTFTLAIGVTPVAGAVTYSGTTATFTPSSPLVSGVNYTATITTGAKNVAGTPIASNFIWGFSTVPITITTNPLDLATNVPLNKVITVLFSEAMNAATITGATFTLAIGVTPVAGAVTYSGLTASFTPSSFLISDNVVYTATITTGAKNPGGGSLASNYVWTFSTVPHLGPAFVNLNTAARFGIYAGVGISNNAGPSIINNLDVGINPGFRTSVTGFPPATIVGGAIFAYDDLPSPATQNMLDQAKTDMIAAYGFAAGAVTPAPATIAGDQGGLTLAPGIYKSTSSLLVQSGDLTLDAQGDINATWIFQIASTFTSIGGAGGNIILSGGAQAKNITWQVGSSATIGDNTIFYGNVLALTSITLNTNAVATGRMQCQNGAVTMTSTNTINKP